MADLFATSCDRARAHARRGRFADAAAADRRALEQLQDWTGAETAAREVLARKADDPLAQETLARVLHRQRRPAEAEAVARGAAAGSRPDATLTLARTLLDQRNHADAIAAYR